MSRVIHFEINADQPERLVSFYERVFGWKIRQTDGPQPYWLITTGSLDDPGIDGGMMRRTAANDPPVTAIIRVNSLADALTHVSKSGGMITTQPQAIPGVGLMAYITDPEGREFGLMQMDA